MLFIIVCANQLADHGGLGWTSSWWLDTEPIKDSRRSVLCSKEQKHFPCGHDCFQGSILLGHCRYHGARFHSHELSSDHQQNHHVHVRQGWSKFWLCYQFDHSSCMPQHHHDAVGLPHLVQQPIDGLHGAENHHSHDCQETTQTDCSYKQKLWSWTNSCS